MRSLGKGTKLARAQVFVKVPSGAVAPTKYKPMEIDAIRQVADGREQRKRHARLQQPNYLTTCGVRVEDKSKRTETERPQFGKRCEIQSERDSAMSAKSDENEVELNGETDNEDMEDEETGFDDGSAQVGNLRACPRPTGCQRTPRKHDHPSTVQIMVQVLCDGTRCELTAQEIGCSR